MCYSENYLLLKFSMTHIHISENNGYIRGIKRKSIFSRRFKFEGEIVLLQAQGPEGCFMHKDWSSGFKAPVRSNFNNR